MIERTEAVVLKSQNWGETSRIVSVFSRQHGLLKLVARGARRPKSRFGAAFETGHVVQAVFYRSRSSDLHTASEASIAWRPSCRDHSPERTRVIAAGLEIPLRAAAPETPILALYRNLCSFLSLVDSTPEAGHPGILLDFVLRSLGNLGYYPTLDSCISCRQEIKDRSAGFSLQSGGLACHRCGGGFSDLMPVSLGQVRWLAGWRQEGKSTIHRTEAVKLVSVLLSFLNCQLPDRVKLRCFRQL
jgi:DNA repair protein RecO (recombination protein O)